MTSFEKLKTKLAGAMESPRETTEESPLEKPDANPRTATLRKIARALGISLEQLTD
jgi:DNA-binding phage protein